MEKVYRVLMGVLVLLAIMACVGLGEPTIAKRKVIHVQEMQEGDGARVKRLFPTNVFDHYDPFVLIDEFFVTPPAGFPPHPHRGFEAITYMIEGEFRHEDNLGNASTVAAGGAQRFTAGKGIVHSEMPGQTGTAHGLQLWINLPQHLKKIDPGYQQVNAAEFPLERLGNVEIRHIVGGESPLKLNTSVIYQDIQIRKGGQYDLTLLEGYVGFIYVIDGQIRVDTQAISSASALLLPLNDHVLITAASEARLVLVAGVPHQEPIRQRGPFVD